MKGHTGLQAQIEQIQQAYLARLPNELAELSRLADSLHGSAEADSETLPMLVRGLHKIAGSGGSFGLDALSADARALEHSLEEWSKTPGKNDEQVLSAISLRIRQLADLLDPQALTVQPSSWAEEAPIATGKVGCLRTNDKTVDTLAEQMGAYGFEIIWLDDWSAISDGSLPQPHIIMVDMDQALNVRYTRADDDHHHLIGLSTEDDFHVRKVAVQSGLDDFCHKSIDASELVARIERVVSRTTAPPARVLLVDDDESLTQLYRASLVSAGMEVKILEDHTHIMAVLEEFHPELVLMDLQMPEVSGIELARIIRLHEAWSTLPIVFLSSETDINKQALAVTKAYADDFLTKPVPDITLVAAVQSRVARSRQLRELMMTDSLTGLMTHARIKDALQLEISRAARRGKPVSVAMLDLDHFKQVNDQFGHPAGDKVIGALAALIRHAFRVGDMKGRYGGEEFLIILPDASVKETQQLLERLRQRFSKLTFTHDEQVFSCTLSVGMASSDQFTTAEGDHLLEAADQALYAAKRAGRNCVKVAESASLAGEPEPEQGA